MKHLCFVNVFYRHPIFEINLKIFEIKIKMVQIKIKFILKIMELSEHGLKTTRKQSS